MLRFAANLSLILDGQEPTAEATWNAVCLADFGDGGVAFVARAFRVFRAAVPDGGDFVDRPRAGAS